METQNDSYLIEHGLTKQLLDDIAAGNSVLRERLIEVLQHGALVAFGIAKNIASQFVAPADTERFEAKMEEGVSVLLLPEQQEQRKQIMEMLTIITKEEHGNTPR